MRKSKFSEAQIVAMLREYEAGIPAAKEIIPLRLDDTALPSALAGYQGVDFRRQETHGDLAAFVSREFPRSPNRHYRAKDERGEYRDWDHEEHTERENSRYEDGKRSQHVRSAEIAREIVTSLTG